MWSVETTDLFLMHLKLYIFFSLIYTCITYWFSIGVFVWFSNEGHKALTEYWNFFLFSPNYISNVWGKYIYVISK